MTAAKNIAQQLRAEVATRAKLEPEKVESDAHFVIDLGLSSLDMLAVLAFAEKEFAARFPDEVLAELTTLSKAVAAVNHYQCHQKELEQ